MIPPIPAGYKIKDLNEYYILTLRPIKITRSRTNRLTVFGGFGGVYE